MNEESGSSMKRRDLLALLAGLGLSADAGAQDPARSAPRSYRVVLENERVRVIEYTSRPGLGICGHGVHSHPDHVTILLTDSKARVTQVDGSVIVADGKAGDVFWEPASTHTTENVGGKGARAYMVEVKGPGWSPSTG